MEQGDLTKAHCNTCCGDRNHFVLFDQHDPWKEQISDDPMTVISGEDRYELLRCTGCDHVVLRHKSWFSENFDEQGRPVVTLRYYPPATIRNEPPWLHGLDLSAGSDVSYIWLPAFVAGLLHEVYVALQNDCRSLAVMGLRALLEQVMIDKVGDHGSFRKNLDKFQEKGLISKIQRESLEATLDAGHAAIHRNFGSVLI